MSVKGQEEETSYPYTSGADYNTGTCNYDSSKAVATISSYYIISDKDIETNMVRSLIILLLILEIIYITNP